MTYYNLAKLVILVSTLVFLSGSLPQGHAQVQPQLVTGLTGLLNITRIQFTTVQLACTPTGNPPSTGGGVAGVAGALFGGSCNGATGSLAGVFTNASGFAQGILTLAEGIVIDPSRGMPCFINTRLPVTGTTCTVLPPTGLLQAVFQLISVVTNPFGGLLAVATTGPWVIMP
ncbi:hypothetical protein DCAR_0209288 [Daucus carota subsp. sativus]|uniref:Uncharacterized protein n=1 Tax=Daucus carota subsp. sativus TaxID=79200 RepID=A0A166F5U7_DAUCS|nr:hypothetical protein DCAR_0209288 [Daucus carota subsp. sativus]